MEGSLAASTVYFPPNGCGRQAAQKRQIAAAHHLIELLYVWHLFDLWALGIMNHHHPNDVNIHSHT